MIHIEVKLHQLPVNMGYNNFAFKHRLHRGIAEKTIGDLFNKNMCFVQLFYSIISFQSLQYFKFKIIPFCPEVPNNIFLIKCVPFLIPLLA